jgi:hypothetical protein
MIPDTYEGWLALFLAFGAGSMFGMFVVALCVAASRGNREGR